VFAALEIMLHRVKNGSRAGSMEHMVAQPAMSMNGMFSPPFLLGCKILLVAYF
jgi:hypothetical protein